MITTRMATDAMASRFELPNRNESSRAWPATPPGHAAPLNPLPGEGLAAMGADTGTPPGRAQFNATRKIGRALAFMRQNLDQPIPISRLATLAGVSLSNFYYLFKLATGCAPNDYLIRARMLCACDRLGNSDLSVKEVAASLGYHDPFYFSRVFKAVASVAPGHYRKLDRPLQQEIQHRLGAKDPGGNPAAPRPERFHLTLLKS